MTTWQFHCPQCAGLFQIDSSYAGQTVGCPLCGAPVTLPGPQGGAESYAPPPPSYGSPAGSGYGSGYAPPPPAPPGPSWPPAPQSYLGSAPAPQPMQLSCPYCAGGFLVGPEMAGQDVACPHCHQGVTVPGMPLPPTRSVSEAPPTPTRSISEAPSYPPPPAPIAPKPKSPEPVLEQRYPPGFDPTAKNKPVDKPKPVSTEPAANRPLPTNLYPPGFDPPGAVKPTPVPAPAPTSMRVEPVARQDDRLPPGAAPKTPEPARPTPAPAPPRVEKPIPTPVPAPTPIAEKPVEKPVESVPAPAAKQHTPSKIDDLLPPGAGDIDSLLPPGAATAAPVSLPTPASVSVATTKKSTADALLPPGADEAPVSGPLQQVALPEKEMAEANRPQPVKKTIAGKAAIQTPEGDVVALQEPVKTVGHGANERELHVLSPEAKQKRRFMRNLIVYTFALIVLAVVFAILTQYG